MNIAIESSESKFKNSMNKLYNGFCIPALIVHELLHYILIKLTFAKFTRVSVFLDENYEKNGRLSVGIFYIATNKFQRFFISMAPLLALLIFPSLLLMGFKILSIISLVYTILCIRVVLPSKDDYDAIKGVQASYIK